MPSFIVKYELRSDYDEPWKTRQFHADTATEAQASADEISAEFNTRNVRVIPDFPIAAKDS